jgi:hypothetical protein
MVGLMQNMMAQMSEAGRDATAICGRMMSRFGEAQEK